ncbi:uncharacterized protein K452DRAFT_107983 [Aplosporella prunicola CBS 121167]|uniref:Uncharacterized protein n=1 Tax=Aplosporella prunicola CBS 121167 TaxID=1176127 RepID=A0A6A6BRZ3_9PEZI|nr:uncharacterized protein K452DRAFT_107983 [Aplosporella prunicola CBS 121167]KAF2146243.1 hypothetical protein K452DRAFT_107983 [Aplosporella prunicola CBS 121167]
MVNPLFPQPKNLYLRHARSPATLSTETPSNTPAVSHRHDTRLHPPLARPSAACSLACRAGACVRAPIEPRRTSNGRTTANGEPRVHGRAGAMEPRLHSRAADFRAPWRLEPVGDLDSWRRVAAPTTGLPSAWGAVRGSGDASPIMYARREAWPT